MKLLDRDSTDLAGLFMAICLGLSMVVLSVGGACAAKGADPNAHWSDGYILLAEAPDNRPPDSRPPEPEPEPTPAAVTPIVVDRDDDVIVVPGSSSSSAGCDTAGAAIGVKAGGFSMSFPTYPCSIARTYQAIEHTLEVDENGERLHGFWTGNLPRFFLRARLITKGVFSAIFGLIGLG